MDAVEAGSQRIDGTELAKLQTSVRRIRAWLIAVTAVLAIAMVGILVVVAPLWLGIGSTFDGSGGIGDEEIVTAKQEILDAYGEQLGDIEVRAVRMSFEVVPFPYSMLTGGDPESLYVRYTLRGSDVVVADVVSGMFGDGILSSGMVPTKGSLASRMSQEQLERLLAAYSAETKAPLGAIRRYNDTPGFAYPGESPPTELVVGDSTFATKELWRAVEGIVVEGDSIDTNDDAFFTRNSLVFREDPATGQFTFLGTEPAEMMW